MTDRNMKNLKDELLLRLRPLRLEAVILFGSVAKGEDTPESDVDLYVVTCDETIPANWSEKNRIYLGISRHLRDLHKKYPIDLIVHTKAMYEQFMPRNSLMANEIRTNGLKLV